MMTWALLMDLGMERWREVVDVLLPKSIGRSLNSEGFCWYTDGG